jgi:hypothetical protein
MYQMTKWEPQWTNKLSVYNKFCTPNGKDMFRYSANWIVLRKMPHTIQFLQEWTHTMKHFDWLQDDAPETQQNDDSYPKDFQEHRHDQSLLHRHDQSLLSLLLKCQWGEPGKKQYMGNKCFGRNF